jgi:lipooligosaccharide transport system ATP-binding protein
LDVVVAARKLVKKYNGMEAVKGIDFTVRARECFGILGPNGAGKSSTINMLIGLSPVTAGELRVFGLDVRTAARQIKRRLGVVPQDNNLDTDLTVMQNLVVYASYFNIPRHTARTRGLELLKFFDLAAKSGEKVEHLSGGMKRRLTIARALINDPELVVLDEPTTGLDPQARHLVWQRLFRLKERGVTLILTTHYMEEAGQLCDRLVIMDRGTILDTGTPCDLVHRHIGTEVLELGRAAAEADTLLAAVGPLIRGYQVVGDDLVLYPRDGRALLGALQDRQHRFARLLLRPASLEDVFLKLTGRGFDG